MFAFFSSHTPQTAGKEEKFLHKNFTFFALRHKINYYQITSRFSSRGILFFCRENREKFRYMRATLRHILIHSTSFPTLQPLLRNCRNKLFKQEQEVLMLFIFAACFPNRWGEGKLRENIFAYSRIFDLQLSTLICVKSFIVVGCE